MRRRGVACSPSKNIWSNLSNSQHCLAIVSLDLNKDRSKCASGRQAILTLTLPHDHVTFLAAAATPQPIRLPDSSYRNEPPRAGNPADHEAGSHPRLFRGMRQKPQVPMADPGATR